MGNKINVRVEVDPGMEETQVVIRTGERTEAIENMIKAIEQCEDTEGLKVTVYDGDRAVLLDKADIIRVYIENRMLTVRAESGDYSSRLSLRDFEEMLDSDIFVRISRFEVVNLRKVTGFDMSMSGTIGITFEGGGETWVARRCVKNIQEKLSAMSKGGRDHE